MNSGKNTIFMIRKLKKIIYTTMIIYPIGITGQCVVQTVKGTITDRETQIALAGASIIVSTVNPVLGAISDIDGKFRIENVPVGRHNVLISYMGYEQYDIKELVVGSGKEVVLDIGLKESVTELEQVVIKSTTNKDRALNTMAILSARQFTVEETMRYAGGIDDPAIIATSFAGAAGSTANNGIVIRGNAPKGLLWRMEGIDIPNPNHFANLTIFGGGGFTALSSQMLSNSDFFTGAFPAEYGNALSGVFDIRMRTGNNEKYEHTFRSGLLGIDVSSEGPIIFGKNASYLFNYRYSTFGLLGPMLPEDASNIRYQDLSFKLNVPMRKTGTIVLWGIGSNDISGTRAEKDSGLWIHEQDKEEMKSPTAMGAAGISHKINLSKKTFLHSTLAATGNNTKMDISRMDQMLTLQPVNYIKSNTWKYSFSCFINNKFSPLHTNKTGVIINHLFYNMDIRQAVIPGAALIPVVLEEGNSWLWQTYSQSRFDLSPTVTLNTGLHSQYFHLNGKYTTEPRGGIKWRFMPRQSVSLGYGHHSQLEMLNFYLAQQKHQSGYTLPNKNLDFTKAHHIVLGYELKTSENSRLMIEPFYQSLYSIPVKPGTSFSLINTDLNWYLQDSLVNRGTGENAGIDITVERFLNNGYYFLFTTSLFRSVYRGGDNKEHPTRFDKTWVLNALGGKEWAVGRQKKNLFSINGRLNYMGGDRISPLNYALSLAAKEPVYDETNAFAWRKPAALIANLSINYHKNRKEHSSIWSVHFVNILGYEEFYGYWYNYKTQQIEKQKEAVMLPNISYKIEF